MSYRVPFVRPRDHYRCLKPELDAAISDTLAAGDLILRRQLREFEAHLAAFVGVDHAVGVASGYHALHLSMLAAGIGRGDEVIVPAHTFVATVSAVIHCGATPVLVDVDEDFNISVDAVEAAVGGRTKAIVPVHLNGRVCDMERIMSLAEHFRLVVIEDAAQALGATCGGRMAGAFGVAGCFSFYPFKSLGGIGDGGAVTTNDPALARTIRLLRYNGEDRDTGEYYYHGYTALLDNVQAAVLDVKLRRMTGWIARRREIARRYSVGLGGIDGIRLPPVDGRSRRDSFQNYVIRVPERDRLRAHLKEHGIETLVHWAKPMWHHQGLGLAPVHSLRETERVCREVISLPLSAETTDADVEMTIDAVRTFFV